MPCISVGEAGVWHGSWTRVFGPRYAGSAGGSVCDYGLHHFTQGIGGRDWSICFRLGVVIFPLLSENDCDRLLEVFRAVLLSEACVEEFAEAREEHVECLVRDAVGDSVGTWGFVRDCSAGCSLDLRYCNVWAFYWWRVLVPHYVGDVSLLWWREEGPLPPLPAGVRAPRPASLAPVCRPVTVCQRLAPKEASRRSFPRLSIT